MLHGAQRSQLQQLVEQARNDFVTESGTPLPVCELAADSRLPEGEAVLGIRGIPAQSVRLPTANAEAFVLDLTSALWQHGPEFLGIAETQALLEELDASGAATASHVVPRLLNVGTLCEVLRRLVAERVSIRDRKAILEALALAANGETDVGILTEAVRAHLKRALTHQHAASGELPALLIDPALEGVLRGSVIRNKGASTLSLSPAAARDFVAAVRHHRAQAQSSNPNPVVLAAPDVRRFVRQLLEADLPDLPILSPNELLPQTTIRPLGTVSLQSL
jgi:type III secretion protein V